MFQHVSMRRRISISGVSVAGRSLQSCGAAAASWDPWRLPFNVLFLCGQQQFALALLDFTCHAHIEKILIHGFAHKSKVVVFFYFFAS